MKIGFLNQKGGVGKTTLAVNVADAIARKGKRTLLVDADVQGSALEFVACREQAREQQDQESSQRSFAAIGLPSHSIHKELPSLAKEYDCVVIDGPPRINQVSASAIMACDLVLIPVQPSPYDVWATDEILALVGHARARKANLEARFVINRKITTTALGKKIKESLATIEFPLPVLKTEVRQLISFSDTAAKGETVIEAVPTSPAADDIINLVKDIMEFFDEQGRLVFRQTA